MQTTICPPPDQLRDYLSGKLDSDSSNDLARHLQDCVTCERTATELELEPDTLIELLQAELPPGSSSNSDERNGEVSREDSGSASPNASERFTAEMPSELGQYELLSRLGSGGMGAVYLARHKSLDKQVALKLLPALPAQNAEFVARFQREMRAAGKLDHPAIVRTTDAGEQQGIHFLVMDAIDGMNLSSIARAEDKLAISDACEVIRQAAIGLAHAHEKGIVHRDVKPSNLMLDTSGYVCILDFGLAQIGFWDSGSAEITTVGQLMGTLDYMAPEQAERGGAVDYRADLYSLGSTLFRLLTGRAPLAAAPNLTPLEKLRLLATHKPPKLRSLRGDVPEELAQIVDAMLASDPAARPASATHVVELLEPFAAGSDLVGLLNRARSKPSLPEESFVVSPLLQRNLADDARPESAGPDTPPLSTSGGDKHSGYRGLAWLALAGCLAMLCAGIVFVLETGKGQLVIDSQADVHVKIVSVDGQGNREDVDDLQIEPGTKTTRLKSGRYEITIDAASDSFGVTNQTFSIRNGQTVVATITPKIQSGQRNVGAVEPTNEAIDAQTEDPRLSEVVYDGETLDTWLRRLKYERNPEEVSRTLNAIRALANEDLKDVILQPLVDFTLTLDAQSGGWYSQVVPALERCSGREFPATIAGVLSQMGEQQKLILLHYSCGLIETHTRDSVGDYGEFLEATETMLASDSNKTVLATANVLRAIADGATGEAAPLLQNRIVKLLVEPDALTNEAFWLALPATYDSNAPHRDRIMLTACDAVRKEVVRRAIDVIADEHSSDQLITQATVVLRTLAESDVELTEAQQTALAEGIAVRLKQAAQDPSEAYVEVNLPRDLRYYVAPVLSGDVFRSPSSDPAFKMIAIMNLVRADSLQEPLSAELQAVFESFQSLPIYGSDYTIDELRNHDLRSWRRVGGQSGARRETLLRRVIYLQAGSLIGKSETELFARFDKKLPADIALEVNLALDILESGPESKQRSMLAKLDEVMPPLFSPRAAEVIEENFTTNAVTHAAFGSGSLNHSASVWARATGDDFWASYVRALENADEPNRDALLKIAFDEIEGLSCTSPDKMEPLLSWCDQVLGDPEVEINEYTWSVARLLIGLLIDRDEISEACQQLAVDHLENYSILNNQNYWLARQIETGNDPHNGLPARLAVLRKAMEQITDDSSDDAVMDCKALAILSSGVSDIDALSNDQKTHLINELRRRLAAAAEEPSAFVETYELPSQFNPLKPRCMGGYFREVMGGGSVEPANSVILILNLLTDMSEAGSPDLDAATKPEVTALFAATENLNIASRRSIVTNVNNWQDTLRAVTPDQDAIHHCWYLQTGALLGKDVATLNRRPTELYVAEQERKARFVQPGDTLAIHIPFVLPRSGDPPVLQAGKATPVIGFPVPVSDEGKIQLPMFDPMDVNGLELEQVKSAIEKTYARRQPEILGDDVPHVINVQFLLRNGQSLEVRNITGSSVVAPPRKE